jgi:hypothetical protein
MSSHTSTCRTNPGTSSAANRRSGPNGTSAPASRSVPRASSPGATWRAARRTRGSSAVRLGRRAQQPPAVHDGRDVVDAVPVAHRQAYEKHREQVRRARDDLGERRVGGVEEGVLQQDVLERVAGQRQLREDDQPHALVVALPRGGQHGRGVGRRVADHGTQRGGRHAQEAVPVEGAKVLGGHGRVRSPSGRRVSSLPQPAPRVRAERPDARCPKCCIRMPIPVDLRTNSCRLARPTWAFRTPGPTDPRGTPAARWHAGRLCAAARPPPP